MSRFVIYGRVSTSQQDGNTSIPLQEDLCRRFGEQKGWTLVGTFTDTESGATSERLGLNGVFAALQAREADVMVVSRIDRIARTQSVFADTFERVYMLGGKVAIASESRLFDTLTELLHASVFPRAIAEHERLTIRERTESALRQRIKAGGWIGAACYGYELRKRTDGAKEPIPHNEQAQVVKLIFDRVINGGTTRSVALELTANSVRTARHGVAWHNSHVRNILGRGNVYAGEPFIRSWTVGGQKHELRLVYPPLIALETAEEAQRLVATRTHKPASESPFRGLVQCAHCGDSAGATSATGRKGTLGRIHHYTCASRNRSRYHKSMGLPYREDACQHHADHRLITDAVLRFIADFDPDTGASRFQVEAQQVLEKLADRKATVETLEAEIAGFEQTQQKLQESMLRMAEEGDLGPGMRVVGARIQDLDGLMTQSQEAAGIAREYARSLERGLVALGVDPDVELAKPTRPGQFVVDLGGLEKRWGVFEEKAVQLKDALERSDFETARELMWHLGLHVRVDFSRPVLRDVAREIKVEMNLGRINREVPERGAPYEPYALPG